MVQVEKEKIPSVFSLFEATVGRRSLTYFGCEHSVFQAIQGVPSK